MSKHEPKQNQSTDHAHAGIDNDYGGWYYEYRLRGQIHYTEGGFMPFTTEWDHRRDAVIEAAESAQAAGMHVEVETRRIHTATEFEGSPE